jgi:hypothetical protein
VPPKTLDSKMTVKGAYILAEAAAGVTLSLGLIPDYDADASAVRTFTVSLAASGTETRVIREIDGAETAEVRALQVSIGDAAAVASQWSVDAVQLLVSVEASSPLTPQALRARPATVAAATTLRGVLARTGDSFV